LPPLSPAIRGRIVVAAVAAGAIATAAHAAAPGPSSTPTDDPLRLSAAGTAVDALGIGGQTATPEVFPFVKASNPDELRNMAKGKQLVQARSAAQAAAAAEASRPRFVRPAAGVFTSGFGARWGTTHYGIDIANSLGTPEVAAADGTVIEAGPASGFGLWVRIQLSDGTILVYGHMQSILVKEGQKVRAGDEVATMGARGQATGVHLHFEVWDPSGRKIDPLPWLAARGINIA
jgi:murein DD-endopeptidase MepM/ murein hydrolase activator NlpD